MIAASEIEAQLLAFLQREVFGANVSLTPQTNLVAAGFDSMSLVRVLLFVETTFGFWIPESEITSDALRDLQSLATTISRLLHARQT